MNCVLTDTYMQEFDAMFRLCAAPLICGDQCSSFANGLAVDKYLGDCMRSKNTTVDYPLANSTADDSINALTTYIAGTCGFNTGKKCTFYYGSSSASV